MEKGVSNGDNREADHTRLNKAERGIRIERYVQGNDADME